MGPSRFSLWLLAPILAGTAAMAADFGDRMPAHPHQYTARPAGKPATVFLWYADGGAQPEDGPYCTGLKPPAWRCNFGVSADDCQRQVQGYLDRWYANFNVVFTLTRPHTADYYTVIITSTNAWCSLNITEAGVAPFNCNDNPGQTAFAFECGHDAHDCALVIAHEHAHMVGLDHTDSNTDLMYPNTLATIDGFENRENRTPDALCSAKQNSYQKMLNQLGAWPGGEKPSPFAQTPPDAGIAGPEDASDDTHRSTSGTSVGTPPIGDAGTGLLPGFDAVARPNILDDGGPPLIVPRQKAESGCRLQPGSGDAYPALLLLGLVGAAWRRRKSRR